MKFLFWTDGFWPRIGGLETQGLQFIEEMQKRGHQCLVLAQRDHLAMKEEEIYREIFIKRLDFNAIIRNRDLKTIRQAREVLEWIIHHFQPDIIYLNTVDNGSAFAFLLFRNLFQIPTIATTHIPCHKNGIITQQIHSKIDAICCPSKWGYREMKKFLPNAQLRQINCGLSMPTTPPLPLPFTPPTILLMGRLSSEKGFEIAIEAFALLKIDAKLLIVGEGDERPFLEHLVDRLHLRKSVEFTGSIDRSGEEVFSIMNRATFTVMPSHLEPFGLVALESMRMGRPVIASNSGGLPEIVSHDQTGLLVCPNNPIAFYEAMKTLLDDPDKTIEMGARAREWAMNHYLLKDNVDEYIDLFNQTIEEFNAAESQHNSCRV